jgi:hypothetical protein
MDAPNPTVSNSALWAEYLHRQWGWWLEPGNSRNLTAAIAATVATTYGFWFEAVIARLFEDNKPGVTRFVQRVDEVKRDASARERAARSDSFDAVPSWLTTHDAPVEETPIATLAGA